MKVNKKYVLLILLAIFTFNITNVRAYEIEDFTVTDNNTGETTTVVPEDNIITNNVVDTNDYKYVNESTNFSATIDDKANLLTVEERVKLFEEIKPLTEYGHTAFVSIANNYSSVESFADSYYHSNYGTESGTIFIIDMSNRKIYIFSDGANYRTVTSAKAYSITDNTYTYATNKDYYGCASYSFKQIYTILSGGKIAEPMRYTSNIFIAITLAFFFSFLYILSKSKISKASDKSVVNNCDITFQIGATSAIKTGQHSVYSPQSSGSSGGGGGGGGGSSGGGGGHSF
jgi:uncharacterized protein